MLDKLLRSAHLAISSGSESQSATSPPVLLEPTSITLSIPSDVHPTIHVDSVPSSVQHSPNSSISLPVPYTPNSATSNQSSPRLTMPLDSNDMRSAGHSPHQWDFTDYMRMHPSPQNLNVARPGSGAIPSAVTPLYIVPSSHAESHMSAVSSPYGGGHMDSVYASPYPVSPPTGSTSGSYHSSEYHHRHQTTSPTSGDVGNVSWEQFMSSMGL